LKKKTDAEGNTTFVYDPLGALRTVTLPQVEEIEYLIDAAGRRVGKNSNATLFRRWIYDGQLRVVAELDGDSILVNRFIYGSKPNVPDYIVSSSALYRIVSDHVGSPRIVVDASTGAVEQRLLYSEFGDVIEDTHPGFQPFGFAGGLFDYQSKILRYGARDYDPINGRWLAKDPLGFSGGGSNLYSYALSDPINNFDPHGRWVVVVSAAAGAIAGLLSAPEAANAPEAIGEATVPNSGWAGYIKSAIVAAAVAGGVEYWLAELTNPRGDEIPEKAREVLRYVCENDEEAPPGYAGNREFKNLEGLLPEDGDYREYDVDPHTPGMTRNAERLVRDRKTGQAWYTDDHYRSFKPIR
jgi:RHS repeat-associated protein